MDLDLADDLAPLTVSHGRGSFRLEIDRLDLADGSYHVDVGIYAAGWERIYDYLWQALTFEMAGGGGKSLLAPPRRWGLR
jgi:hypothetical protein